MFATGEIVLMDGAMGTQLQRAGMPVSACYEEWNLSRPDVVESIHRAYVEAGAQVLLTNTFQANPTQLARHGLLEKGPDIVRAALRLARAAGSRWVLGSIGPTDLTALETMVSWFDDVDGLLLETWSDASAFAAVRLLRGSRPVLLSMTYRTDPVRGICTLDGLTPEQVAERAVDIMALGVNCGHEQDIDKIAEVVCRYRQVTKLPLFARPNAGTPRNGAYPQQDMDVQKLIQAGVTMIGGCCGTSPADIAKWRTLVSRDAKSSERSAMIAPAITSALRSEDSAARLTDR